MDIKEQAVEGTPIDENGSTEVKETQPEEDRVWVYDRYNRWICLQDKSIQEARLKAEEEEKKAFQQKEANEKKAKQEDVKEPAETVTETEPVKVEDKEDVKEANQVTVQVEISENATETKTKTEGTETEAVVKIEETEEVEKEEEKPKSEWVEVEYVDIIEQEKYVLHKEHGLVYLDKQMKDSNGFTSSENLNIITKDGYKTADCKDLRRSIQVNVNVHSSSGAYNFNFKADCNYQAKNFFNNILKFKLKQKFNFSSYEVFSGENCIKIVDKIDSDFNFEEEEQKIIKAYEEELKKWEEGKQEFEKKKESLLKEKEQKAEVKTEEKYGEVKDKPTEIDQQGEQIVEVTMAIDASNDSSGRQIQTEVEENVEEVGPTELLKQQMKVSMTMLKQNIEKRKDEIMKVSM